ncbi:MULTISPECIES: aromatic-ring-hydroxylating dioxygenase subunit beta [Cupriavidus]|uniref:Aromatic-ring-hydroxylating dioxygenase, beta subunit n=1 Tax=Cupriavidus pinatubonensis (strain JMP 134 / LMG 1197) TaxID=264198 RepID=Q46S16_CUPPJ|nr:MULTISPECIES: aromatic-ring-hydroxylating dioxygenase subunit beta [Cupriavidus]TPQ28806.1 salicylate hydroxylase [Cupriavidus pinatubonensis]
MNFTDYYALLTLHADYTSVVDSGEWDRWPDFFTDDCLYLVQPRENHERGLPLATLSLEGKGMLKDRIYGIRETLFHDPYYQRHIVGTPLIREATGEKIVAETNYAVLRTKPDQMSDVYNVGRYLDTIARTAEGWKFASRLCIFDSEMILNSLIYPI